MTESKKVGDRPPILVLLRIDWPEDGPEIIRAEPTNPNPTWFQWECHMESVYGALAAMLGVKHKYETWMLQNGIAPGQWFLVRIYPPTYRVDAYSECDITYGDWEIVDRAPMSDAAASLAWAGWLADPGYNVLMGGAAKLCK